MLNPETDYPDMRPLVTLQELMIESTEATDWLIKDIYPLGEIVLMTGAAHSGKTYAALDQGLAVAYGYPWLGRFETEARPVIYAPSEGRREIGKRIRSWADYHRPYASPAPFYLFDDRLTLATGDTFPYLQERTERAEAGLVIVDVLRDATAGIDENTAMFGDLFGRLRNLAHDTGATVLVLHHLGKDSSKGARGHSSVLDKTDIQVIVSAKPLTSGDKILATAVTLDAMPPKGKNRNHEPWRLALDLRKGHPDKPGEDPRPPLIVAEWMGSESAKHPRLAVLVAMAELSATAKRPPTATAWRVAEIAEHLNQTKPGTVESLDILAEDGLAEVDKTGKAHLWTLTDDGYAMTANQPPSTKLGDAKTANQAPAPYRGRALGDGGKPTTVEDMLALDAQDREAERLDGNPNAVPEDTGPITAKVRDALLGSLGSKT